MQNSRKEGRKIFPAARFELDTRGNLARVMIERTRELVLHWPDLGGQISIVSLSLSLSLFPLETTDCDAHLQSTESPFLHLSSCPSVRRRPAVKLSDVHCYHQRAGSPTGALADGIRHAGLARQWAAGWQPVPRVDRRRRGVSSSFLPSSSLSLTSWLAGSSITNIIVMALQLDIPTSPPRIASSLQSDVLPELARLSLCPRQPSLYGQRGARRVVRNLKITGASERARLLSPRLFGSL